MPTIEELLNELGDRFRELTWHTTMKEFTAVGIPKKSGKTCKEWKPKKILVSDKTPQLALQKLLNKLEK